MVGVDADGSGAAVEPQAGYSRRFFLKLSATGALGLFVWDALGGVQQVFAAPIPGGTLGPGNVPKFVTPLVIPPPMPTVSPNTYSIAVRQFSQSILPAGLPATTVWSYGAANQLGTLNYPAFTIEAERGTPTQVTWINGLVMARAGSSRTCCRWTRRCTGPTLRAGWRVETRARRSPAHRGPTPVRCRS